MSQLTCKNCGSHNVVRFGHYQGVQRYWCKSCRHKFKFDDNPFRMKTPVSRLGVALHMYYEGIAVTTIRRYLERDYGHYPSSRTIYRWIARYTAAADAALNSNIPKVGSTWIIDEIGGSVYGPNFSVWYVIDSKTLFLLAIDLSLERSGERARALLEKAAGIAGLRPEVIATDTLGNCLDDARQTHTMGGASKFSVVSDFGRSEISLYTLQNRIEALHGFKSPVTARRFLTGWQIHYNYFQQHEALGDRTPAEMAGVISRYQRWDDIVKKSDVL